MTAPHAGSGAAALPDPEAIRRTAEEVVARPEYRLDPSADGRGMLELLLHVLRWVLRPFFWLFQAMEGLPDWLRWTVVVVLGVILVALIAHIIYSIIVAARRPKRPAPRRTAGSRQVSAAESERQAEEAVARGDYMTAIRCLFRACLVRLSAARNRRLRPGMTNHEHLVQYRDSPVFEPMQQFVRTIDVKWYGRGRCDRADYEACREAHARIRSMAQAASHAHGA